ncbi:MAG TPA: BTAD domain-containing putative transcriptional regulator [Gemmatimonadaceae bacterium]|jgi:DNA-binding SARP family transcriptional activator
MDSPLIRLRALGGVDLRNAQEQELRLVLAQPKRVALLAYLALAIPAGYHRRDALLALFWPELDEERARRALRQAVHFLRRMLGSQVIAGRGDDIGLAPGSVWCDVHAFNDALQRGDCAAALALYRGDLLNGFFVTDASSEFDDWLARERAALHRRVIDAAWSLSESREAAGACADAAEWAHWVAARAPDDEPSQRRLIALLDRFGDRTGALRVYEQFAGRMRKEFGAEPSAETSAQVAAIRARNTVNAASASAEQTAPGLAAPSVPPVVVAPPPPISAVIPPRRPRWRMAALMIPLLFGGAYAIHAARHDSMAAVSTASVDDSATRGASGADSRAPRDAVTTSSRTARRLFEAGLHALYDRGDVRTAHTLFLDALQDDSTFAMAAYYVSRCDVLLELPGEGRAMMVAAVRLATGASERERLIIALAWSSMIGKPDRMALAESLATRFPDNADGQLALGGALAGIGDFLGAVPHLRHVIDADSAGGASVSPLCATCDAFNGLVEAYVQADSFPAAERVAHEWVRRWPRSTAPWSALREILAREGRVREAQDAARQVTVLDPAADLTLSTALIDMHVDDFPAAANLLAQHARYGSRGMTEQELWWLVIARRNQGRLGAALAAAHELRRMNQSDSANQSGAIAEAQVMFEQGRFREAGTLFDSLAAMSPPGQPVAPSSLARQRCWMLTQAATAFAAAGDTARLAAMADTVEGLARLSAYGRDWTLPHYLRALLWKARGDPQQELAELHRAIWSPSEGYTRASLELARVSLAVGHPLDAVRIMQSALHGPMDASNFYLTRTEIHDMLARAFAAAGQADSAAAHSRTVAQSWRNGDTPFRVRAGRRARRILHAVADATGRSRQAIAVRHDNGLWGEGRGVRRDKAA